MLNLSFKIFNLKILNGLCFGLFLLMYFNNGRNLLVISGLREVDVYLIKLSFGRFEFFLEKLMAKKVFIDVNVEMIFNFFNNVFLYFVNVCRYKVCLI